VRSIAPAFAAYKLSAVFRCCWACGACGQRSCVVHKSTGLSLHGTQPEDKSALAKTAPSDNYPSARPPRLILIDAVLTQIVALYEAPEQEESSARGPSLWALDAVVPPRSWSRRCGAMQTRSAISCSQASTGFRQDANIKRCLNAEFTFYAIEAFRVGLTSKSQGAARCPRSDRAEGCVGRVRGRGAALARPWTH